MKAIFSFLICVFYCAFADAQTSTIKVKKNCDCGKVVISKYDIYYNPWPSDTSIHLGHVGGKIYSLKKNLPLAYAVITISGKDSVYLSVRSDNTGAYSMGNLPVGKYLVTCCAQDHQTYINTEVYIKRWETTPLDIRLKKCE